MPVITYEAGQMSADVKKQLIERLTTVAMDITGAPRQYFTVLIRKQPDENIGVGGEPLCEMKARLSKEAPL